MSSAPRALSHPEKGITAREASSPFPLASRPTVRCSASTLNPLGSTPYLKFKPAISWGWKAHLDCPPKDLGKRGHFHTFAFEPHRPAFPLSGTLIFKKAGDALSRAYLVEGGLGKSGEESLFHDPLGPLIAFTCGSVTTAGELCGHPRLAKTNTSSR